MLKYNLGLNYLRFNMLRANVRSNFLFLIIFFCILVSCSTSKPHLNNIPVGSVKIIITPENAVRIKEIENEVGTSLVPSPEIFAESLTAAIKAAYKLTSTSADEFTVAYGNDELRESDLYDICFFIKERMPGPPKFYSYDDSIGEGGGNGMIWQFDGYYKGFFWNRAMTGEGIDLSVKKGNFATSNHEINLQELSSNPLCKGRTGRQSIHPHFATVKICMPKCDEKGIFGISQESLKAFE
jgi:hypothetical protein